MSLFKRKRLWSKGREGMYMVSAAGTSKKVKEEVGVAVRARNRSKDSSAGGSVSCSSDSVSTVQFKREKYETRASSNEPSTVTSYKHYSLPNDAEVCHVMSTHSTGGARLLSIRRKKSVTTLQHIEVHETYSMETEDVPEDTGGKPHDTENSENVPQEQGACFFGDNLNDNEQSDSGSSMEVSDSSEHCFAVSSDSESEEEKEFFDLDAHIERLCARENDDSDTSSERSQSDDDSEAAFKKAVRKVIRRIKRERSHEIADSDSGSRASSEKSSDDDDPANSDNDFSEGNDGESNDSSLSGKRGLEMARDFDPEFVELMENKLIIGPKNGNHSQSASSVVYRDDRIDSILETMETNPEDDECHCIGSRKESSLTSSLDTDKVQDLRWPLSSYYIKEVQHIPGGEDALPSYRSTEASPSTFPGRKRNVMLGRVWWAEWWAREDTKIKSHTGLDLDTMSQ